MPPTRRTANLRHFNTELKTALNKRSLQNTPYGDISNAAWQEIFNEVSYNMTVSEAVQFYQNSGNGTRTRVVDRFERAQKLTRFLKRTIDSTVPHITAQVKTVGSSAPWVQIHEQSGARAGDDGSSEGSSESSQGAGEGQGDDNQNESQSGSGNSSDSQSESGDGELTSEEIAALSGEQRVEAESQKYQAGSNNQQEDEFAKWWRILAKLREYCRDAKEQGLPIDDFESYRPGIMGAAMIREGITADACADAATAHWSEDAREEVGISKVNVAEIIPAPEGRHPAAGYVAKLMRARIPIMLHGGAGVGKTTLARDAADMFNLPFGMLSMTAGLSTTALTGSVNLQGFVSRPCVDTFAEGGVFLFDEMDAADPNLLLICNTMLANGEFHSPVTGERLERHNHWFPFAAVNTLNGANTAYTGRTRLDHATMDRWRMGRIRMEFDLDLALQFATQELSAA